MAMCAEGGSRTHMGVIPLRSERSASACSATSAIFLFQGQFYPDLSVCQPSRFCCSKQKNFMISSREGCTPNLEHML